MRVLFNACPSEGHVYPLVSLAWALRAAGHQVLVTSSEAVMDGVKRAGLLGVASFGSITIPDGMLHGRPPQEIRTAADLMIGDEGLGAGYARLAEWAFAETDRLVRAWRPDLMVCEPTAMAGMLAAGKHGIPLIEHRWGLRSAPEVITATMDRLESLREEIGLATEPKPELIIDVCPPSLQYPDVAAGTAMRYVPYNGGTDGLPDWVFQPPSSTRVCLTVGTALPGFAWGLRLVRELLDGLRELPVEVVLAMNGEHVAQLGLPDPLPSGVRAAERVPLDLLLPSCAAVVHHGGAGTMSTALVHGLPQVIVPSFGDSHLTAERIAQAGAGLGIPIDQVSSTQVRDTTASLLDEDNPYRRRARAFASEIAEQRPPAEIVSLLEDLVTH